MLAAVGDQYAEVDQSPRRRPGRHARGGAGRRRRIAAVTLWMGLGRCLLRKNLSRRTAEGHGGPRRFPGTPAQGLTAPAVSAIGEATIHCGFAAGAIGASGPASAAAESLRGPPWPS